MLNFLRKKECLIYAPSEGKIIDIKDVPDPVFSKKMMGEGVGFIFEGDTLFSPIDGKVLLVAETKHAVGFQASNGAEILLHVGLDTVSLNGSGFEIVVKEGEKVKHGSPIIRINREIMNEKNINLTTPIVVTNPDFGLKFGNVSNVSIDSVLFECFKK